MSDALTTSLSDGIFLVDTEFMRPRFAASYILRENGRAAYVETGTARNADRLVSALGELDLDAADVDYVILTHVHLDHAGGAGALIERLPNAKLVVHPRGARHMIDPSKLVAGATAVYGEAFMEEHYGTILATPAERVVESNDGFTLELAGRPLRFLETRGHAKHHVCIWDERSRGLFTGDTFGLAYPELGTADAPFIFPTTTPVDFDPPAMRESIRRLLDLKPEWIYLTHFGRVGGATALAEDLRADIDRFVTLASEVHGDNRHAELATAIEEHLLARLDRTGSPADLETRKRILSLDIDLNAQGLEVWKDRQAAG